MPHMQQLKKEVKFVSIFMWTLPFIAFFAIQNSEYVLENYGANIRDLLSGLTAVLVLQIVIGVTIIVKYWEDMMIVWRGEGHLPYDPAMKETSAYF